VSCDLHLATSNNKSTSYQQSPVDLLLRGEILATINHPLNASLFALRPRNEGLGELKSRALSVFGISLSQPCWQSESKPPHLGIIQRHLDHGKSSHESANHERTVLLAARAAEVRLVRTGQTRDRVLIRSAVERECWAVRRIVSGRHPSARPHFPSPIKTQPREGRGSAKPGLP
jgi:hypothetical protein